MFPVGAFGRKPNARAPISVSKQNPVQQQQQKFIFLSKITTVYVQWNIAVYIKTC